MTDPASLPVPATPAPRGAVNVERMAAPQPGTYWKASANIAERSDNQMDTPTLAKGTVLMLSSVEFADGEPHVYHFAPHPNWDADADGVKVHADLFYQHFEPAPEGEAVRAKELARLIEKMDETKRLMMAPPPDMPSALLLSHDPTQAIGEPGTELATAEQIQSITHYAEAMRDAAEKQSKWITRHSETLGKQGGRLAAFHKERAQAALARAHAQLEGVKGVLRTVANLEIYIGKGVEVIPLREGEPAARDERITIYQDVLSLDEESLILLDQGGLDHCNTEALIDALEDPALVQRLIPAQRGMVLVRFRNSYKEFVKTKPGADAGERISAGLINEAMTKESRRVRLLIRDGEQLTLVDADDILKPIKQLMPTQAEQDGHFLRKRSHWREPERITRDDMDYAAAQREQLGAIDNYGKVLVMLWGLHDRTGLFDAAGIPRMTNWLDPAMHGHYLHLVSHDVLLGVERPDFKAWQAQQNKYLVAGSWVAVDLGKAFIKDNAPGAFSRVNRGRSYQDYYDRFWKPSADIGGVFIDRVRQDKDGLFVEVPTVYDGYGRGSKGRTMMTKLWVRQGTAVAEGVLTLDRVRAPDLSYYLESRQQRRNYEAYIELFRAAREWVRQRDAAEQPMRDMLRRAVTEAGIAHDADSLDDRITDALAVARAARRDRALPEPGTSAFKSYQRGALDALHAALSDNGQRIASIEVWAKTHGRELLRLAITSRGVWRLYLVPSASEHDPRLGEPRHASTADVEFDADGAPRVSINGRAMLRQLPGEQVVHDWAWEVPTDMSGLSAFARERTPKTRKAGAPEWLEKAAPFRLSYAEAIEVLDAPLAHSAAFEALDLRELVSEARAYMFKHSKNTVQRMKLTLAVGCGLVRGVQPVVLFAEHDALQLAYNSGDPLVQAEVRSVIESIYKHPEAPLGRLENSGYTWRLTMETLDGAAGIRKTLRAESYERESLREDHCKAPGQAGRYDTEIIALTDLGARLFPEIANLGGRMTAPAKPKRKG